MTIMSILVWDELDANGRPIEIDSKEVNSYKTLVRRMFKSLQGCLCRLDSNANHKFFVYFST